MGYGEKMEYRRHGLGFVGVRPVFFEGVFLAIYSHARIFHRGTRKRYANDVTSEDEVVDAVAQFSR